MRNKFLDTGEAGYHPVRKIKVCLSGMRYAMRYDFSVAYKVYLSLATVATCLLLRQWLDLFLVLTVTTLVLVAELFNSAIEALCDFIENRENQKIKVIKDISAAAAGLTILLWVVVLAVEVVKLGGVLLG